MRERGWTAIAERERTTQVKTITREFVTAVVEGIHALRQQSEELTKTPEYKASDGVGNILRSRVEHAHEAADLLAGWVKRHLDDVAFPPDQFDI